MKTGILFFAIFVLLPHPAPGQGQGSNVSLISARALHERLKRERMEDLLLVDIRSATKHEEFNIGGTNIPITELLSNRERLTKIWDRWRTTVLYDESGDYDAVNKLLEGYQHPYFELEGGIESWIDEYGKTSVRESTPPARINSLPTEEPSSETDPPAEEPTEEPDPEPDDPDEPPPAKVITREFRGMQLMHRSFFSGGQGS